MIFMISDTDKILNELYKISETVKISDTVPIIQMNLACVQKLTTAQHSPPRCQLLQSFSLLQYKLTKYIGKTWTTLKLERFMFLGIDGFQKQKDKTPVTSTQQ